MAKSHGMLFFFGLLFDGVETLAEVQRAPFRQVLLVAAAPYLGHLGVAREKPILVLGALLLSVSNVVPLLPL